MHPKAFLVSFGRRKPLVSFAVINVPFLWPFSANAKLATVLSFLTKIPMVFSLKRLFLSPRNIFSALESFAGRPVKFTVVPLSFYAYMSATTPVNTSYRQSYNSRQKVLNSFRLNVSFCLFPHRRSPPANNKTKILFRRYPLETMVLFRFCRDRMSFKVRRVKDAFVVSNTYGLSPQTDMTFSPFPFSSFSKFV